MCRGILVVIANIPDPSILRLYLCCIQPVFHLYLMQYLILPLGILVLLDPLPHLVELLIGKH